LGLAGTMSTSLFLSALTLFPSLQTSTTNGAATTQSTSVTPAGTSTTTTTTATTTAATTATATTTTATATTATTTTTKLGDCSSQQYETADGGCVSLTECDPSSEFVAVPATATSDRVCEPQFLDLLPAGPVHLDGSRGVEVLTHDRSVAPSFSIAAALSQQPGTSGYIVAKSTASGSRYYSLLSGAGSLTFIYRIPNSERLQTARFSALLDDAENHIVLISINGRVARLFVDGESAGQLQLAGNVGDCGAYGPDCLLFVGQRAGNSNFFEGTIQALRLFDRSALSFAELPASFIASLNRTTPMTTTTSTATTTVTVGY